jgi:Family of unknown function (DUF6308)
MWWSVTSRPGASRSGKPRRRSRSLISDWRTEEGARISAAEIAAILGRRDAIERALLAVAPQASLARAARSVPWQPLRLLFDAFADTRGVGLSKMTKALHPKRPALIPMLDSRRTRSRARPWLQTRPRPKPGGVTRGPAGAREARVRPHRGADPRSAHLVGAGRGLTGPESAQGCD